MMQSHQNQQVEFSTEYKSPNFTPTVIPVEFVVLHYTACSLERTISLLCDPARQASTHIVLDKDGGVYELVQCLSADPLRAWHSGPSNFIDKTGKEWQTFNDHAIGIEIVNENGNIFEFSEAQYTALAKLVSVLKERFPALKDPERIVGHEQIAGFRGKSDPGICFNWERVFKESYPDLSHPIRNARLDLRFQDYLKNRITQAPTDSKARDDFFTELSTECEKHLVP
jgi:N-acetylmuramoyl-L-alanine amidase